ncbi:histone H2AX-like [Primulina huaijiensis]|uniref:histone H2AX-like n=1 Tax=Primulina huaijiensis TaxID=1492673 RepID=UPI003CC74F78
MESTNVATIKASEGKSKARPRSRSERAGLEFPVGRIKRYMKEGKYANRIGAGSTVYLAAVMEYLAAEVLELAGDQAKREKKNRITPSHIRFAVTADEELRGLCGGAMFPSASAPPNIHGDLLPK